VSYENIVEKVTIAAFSTIDLFHLQSIVYELLQAVPYYLQLAAVWLKGA
jgi:hypothetical protein